MGKWYNGAKLLKERIDAWQALIQRLENKLSIPIWAELELGASIQEGDTVRYMLQEYICIASHTKSLLCSPINTEYWKPLGL